MSPKKITHLEYIVGSVSELRLDIFSAADFVEFYLLGCLDSYP